MQDVPNVVMAPMADLPDETVVKVCLSFRLAIRADTHSGTPILRK